MINKIVRAFFFSCAIALVMGFLAYPLTEFLNKKIFHIVSFSTTYNFFSIGAITSFISSYFSFLVQIFLDWKQSRTIQKENAFQESSIK